jgi:hypothetical protein
MAGFGELIDDNARMSAPYTIFRRKISYTQASPSSRKIMRAWVPDKKVGLDTREPVVGDHGGAERVRPREPI